MKQVITYERLLSDTVRGDAIVIKQTITSFVKQEIDDIEQTLSRTIGPAIVSEYEGDNDEKTTI